MRLTGSSSDFMSGYYVTYEINGNEYRSDQVGSTINRLAWNGMSESERRSVMRVFAFAPDRRIEQFGSEGSREMTDYINEKQGWTAVWEAYAKRIEDQQCGPLKEYYSAENYDAKLAELQNNAAGDYDSWYSRLMYYQEYDEAMDVRRKYEAIGQLMSTGRSAYNCIVTAYTKAREASVRAVSKDLISIIVDKALTPNITVAPTAATTGIYTGVADLFFAVTGYSDELTQKVVGKTQGGMDAVEVINAMKELAQLNYQLAAHCYRQAEALSNSIPAEAEAALAICQAKRNEEQLQAARDADAERLETEQQQRDEAIMPEKETTLYDFIVGTPPVWAPDPNWSQSEFNSAYQQYYDRVQSYIAARQGRLDDEYDSLATDYLAWYNNYRSAVTSLSESHSSPIPDPYPYRPTDDTAVLGQYIYFTDAELRAYRQACRQYRLDILNFSTDRAEYSEDARSIWASAVSGLEEINSRRSALVSALSWSYSSSNGGAVQVSFTVSQPNLYDTEEDDGVKDHTASLLDSIAAAADYWSEERAYSWEYTSQLTENLENEMVRVRGEMLDNVRESIAKHNSIKDNFDLAVQFGEQMKDRQDALLENVPDYVAELQGNLVGSSTNGQGVTTYYAPYAPGISDVYSASPKLVQMLSDASDPLAKAQQLGRQLGQIWDEYERLQRCISNAKSAVGYYVSEMNSVAGVGDIYRYRDGYNMPAIADYSDDRASFNAYLNRSKTYDQIHDLTALKLLTADLRGWGSSQTQISLKLAELKGTKST
ncbi:MAG: hypothetical protein IKI65_05245, partial [Firmicutes bacterium]|nr:hypothetical protein [Bacillota bacterium]